MSGEAQVVGAGGAHGQRRPPAGAWAGSAWSAWPSFPTRAGLLQGVGLALCWAALCPNRPVAIGSQQAVLTEGLQGRGPRPIPLPAQDCSLNAGHRTPTALLGGDGPRETFRVPCQAHPEGFGQVTQPHPACHWLLVWQWLCEGLASTGCGATTLGAAPRPAPLPRRPPCPPQLRSTTAVLKAHMASQEAFPSPPSLAPGPLRKGGPSASAKPSLGPAGPASPRASPRVCSSPAGASPCTQWVLGKACCVQGASWACELLF